eukprot:jgi/Bigna1/83116/fgenesh1_pg.102_\
MDDVECGAGCQFGSQDNSPHVPDFTINFSSPRFPFQCQVVHTSPGVVQWCVFHQPARRSSFASGAFSDSCRIAPPKLAKVIPTSTSWVNPEANWISDCSGLLAWHGTEDELESNLACPVVGGGGMARWTRHGVATIHLHCADDSHSNVMRVHNAEVRFFRVVCGQFTGLTSWAHRTQTSASADVDEDKMVDHLASRANIDFDNVKKIVDTYMHARLDV